MRISDWSSDVCSSDLQRTGERHPADAPIPRPIPHGTHRPDADSQPARLAHAFADAARLESGRTPSLYRHYALHDIGDGRPRRRHRERKIGRASYRRRVCQYVTISVVAVSINKKKKDNYTVGTRES